MNWYTMSESLSFRIKFRLFHFLDHAWPFVLARLWYGTGSNGIAQSVFLTSPEEPITPPPQWPGTTRLECRLWILISWWHLLNSFLIFLFLNFCLRDYGGNSSFNKPEDIFRICIAYESLPRNEKWTVDTNIHTVHTSFYIRVVVLLYMQGHMTGS